MAKVQMPLYIGELAVEELDELREDYAKEVGVPTISRGDYVTRLVTKEKERTELAKFGANKA